MKKIDDLYQKPIICIATGKQIGDIKEVIFNNETGSIEFLAIDGKYPLLGARVIAKQNILSIGENAITIQSEQSVEDINSNSRAVELVKKGIEIPSTRVITNKGKFVGKTGEVYIDEDSCEVIAFEFIPDLQPDTIKVMPKSCIMTISRELIIVNENIEELLVDNVELLDIKKQVTLVKEKETAHAHKATQEKKAPESKPQEQVKEEVREEVKEEIEPQVSAPVEDENKPEEEASEEKGSLFEQRQKKFLIGRKATKTVYDTLGNIIVKDDEEITEQIVDVAKQHGKLIEIVMNNRQ